MESSSSSSSTSSPRKHQIQPLCLQEHQADHYHRILKILSKFYFYVDGSEMGSGKTYVAAAVAITLKLPCIVVCPLAARNTWATVFLAHGVQIYDLPQTGGIITYSTLRSRKGCQPKHGLLVRDDSGETVQFYPTTYFSQIIQGGVLIIFDECQNLKNTSDQYRAVKTMMYQFYGLGGESRAAFLSGTLMDKEEHVTNFLRMVGFINSRNLYSKIGGRLRLEGVEDLHTWARRIDAKNLENFKELNIFSSTRKGSAQYVFKLFRDVIRPGILSIMPRPKMDAYKDVKNGYYKIVGEDENYYRQAINNLIHSVHWNEETGEIYRTNDNMGAVTKALVCLQKAKVGTMIRVAKDILTAEKTDDQGRPIINKVILFADYYEGVIDRLLQEFKAYNPVELTGRISENKRNANIELFQQPNNHCQLLIGNPLVGGLSVNLHDTTGFFPRIMLIMPDYRINELHQATGRIFRTGTKGIAKIRFFYGISGSRENSILSALARKGKIMKEILKEQSDNGVLFPDEYENEYEVILPVESPTPADV